MRVAGVLAIVAGLLIVPLKFFPVVWRGREPEPADAGRFAAASPALEDTFEKSAVR
jgi:hypothetical protein